MCGIYYLYVNSYARSIYKASSKNTNIEIPYHECCSSVGIQLGEPVLHKNSLLVLQKYTECIRNDVEES